MSRYEDLTPYVYAEAPLDLLNIGWLGSESAASNDGGLEMARLLQKLHELSRRPQNLMMGLHSCEICLQDRADGLGVGLEVPAGTGELWLFGRDGSAYSAPVLIEHYIVDHGYMPPEGFLRAAFEELPLPPDARSRQLSEVLLSPIASLDDRANAAITLAWWGAEAEPALVGAYCKPEEYDILYPECAQTIVSIWRRKGSANWHSLEEAPSFLADQVAAEWRQ